MLFIASLRFFAFIAHFCGCFVLVYTNCLDRFKAAIAGLAEAAAINLPTVGNCVDDLCLRAAVWAIHLCASPDLKIPVFDQRGAGDFLTELDRLLDERLIDFDGDDFGLEGGWDSGFVIDLNRFGFAEADNNLRRFELRFADGVQTVLQELLQVIIPAIRGAFSAFFPLL